MRHRLRAAIAAATITAASLVAAPAADAVPVPLAGFTAVGTIYEHYNYGGSSQGLFVNDPCDSLGFTFNPKAMYAGVANWAHIISSIYLTGNGGCTGIKVYARTNPAVTWVCPGTSCAGKIVNLAAPFNDNVGQIRVFRA